MASLIKRPGSKIWYVQFKDETGKVRRLSTKTDRKKIADKILSEYQVIEARAARAVAKSMFGN